MRLYIKILLVFCFSGLGSPWIKAQPTLETLLHLDKSFYVSGEVVWFKLYLPSTWEGTDVAINTAIIDEQQVTIDQFFIKSAGRSFADGYFQIPYNQSSGFLEIQFSASSDPQKPEEILAYYSFPIYNDLNVPSDIEIADNVDAKSDPTLFNEEISIDLNLASDQVNIRDQVGLSLTIKDKDGQPLSGHASLSVKDAHLSQINIGENTIKTLVLSPTVMQADLKSSVYCRGMLSNPDGTPLQMNVLGGYVGDAQHIYYSKSFDNGNYQIDLPDFTGKKGIQLIGFQYEHPDLRSEVVTPKLLGNHQKIIYTKDIIEYLELSRLRKKIYQYFETQEMDLQPEEIAIQAQALKPDARYSVKEYESFKDMKSFFGELLTPLRFKQEKDSTYIATLFNAKGGKRSNTILNGPPLFIIDGKMTRDADFVARLPISAVETVELFLDAPKLRSSFQAIGVSGVVRITTSIANLKLPEADAGNIHTIYGLQPKAHFPGFNAQVLTDQKHEPFFRPQLFWNPDIPVGPDGMASTTFVQSDDTGPFLIEVVFQTADGRRGTKSFQYEATYE